MAANKVELQLPQCFRFNFDVGEFAEPGADSVDDVTALENLFDDVARFANSFSRLACQFDRFVAKRDGVQLRKRNRSSSNFHSAILAAGGGNDKVAVFKKKGANRSAVARGGRRFRASTTTGETPVGPTGKMPAPPQHTKEKARSTPTWPLG